MWRLRYYLTTGQLVSKQFESMAAAVDFSVYKISCWEVHDCYLED